TPPASADYRGSDLVLCSATDTGNMEVLVRSGTPEQRRPWLTARTVSLAEERRFEPSVPSVMDGDSGRQVPTLIAVFKLAGTAVALQRGTKVVRPDRHPEFR